MHSFIKKYKQGFLIILFVIISLLLPISSVRAQQVSLSLSPPLIDAVMKPGKSILIAYTVGNYGDPTILKANVLPFTAKDNMGNITIGSEFTGPVRFSLDNSGFQLNEPFFLKGNDSDQILLRIRIPEGAPEGDYYYTLLVQTQPPPTQEGVTASRATATIGSNILITVTESGASEVKAKVAFFDIVPRFKLPFMGNTYRFVDSSDPIPVVLIVQNNGKNRIKPAGTITLQGNFGEKAAYDIVPQNILSESQRVITASSSATIERKENQSMVLSGFFIGSYKLSAQVNFGEGTTNIYGGTSFIALPFRFIIGAIISLSVAIILVRWIKKRQSE